MRQKRFLSIFLGLLVHVLVISSAADIKNLNIWPMPKDVSHGHGSLYLDNDFELKTDGSRYPDSSGILKDGFLTLIDLVKGTHVIEANFSHLDSSLLLKGIHIVVSSPSDELQHGIDESYKLYIPAAQGNPLYAHLEAQTVYGALHGLQTFSQVCHFNFTSRAIVVHQVPWTIVDQPRFSYRGLLIDTSRHYQPVAMIKKVIDSMSYAKLNVLHWHIVDSQSFPLEIPSYPKLWDGAYSVSERYTFTDAAEIVRQKAVAAGLRCILSNQERWYLDHLDATWQDFYINEPLTNITDPKQQALVLGGEVCMWGERIDASDIEQTIWPRAAAAAERLWTPYDKLPKDPAQVVGRLAHFRCLLNQRGVAAAPVVGFGRSAPRGPANLPSPQLQPHNTATSSSDTTLSPSHSPPANRS
ncbi:Beta-hexosaminidase 3 [Forsythia ovata]|uniref:beta-N-acetylhexosaminidase n=1 Tax=Forsythia ovata TaxID=205694 RepID=A0ABD1WI09_9LAMI